MKILIKNFEKQKKAFGRDRKLRDHTKLKIFAEIEKKLFDTRIDNVKLGQFLKVKQKEKGNFIKYEWARDTNVMNLRFFSYLLMEEIETIIDNMDETRGMNYLNSVDAKLQKRNNIINHLLREKAVTAKLMTKILAIMENTAMDSGDLVNMLNHIEVRDKTRVLGKLKNIIEDMKAVEQIRSFSKGYFNEVDFQNLIAAQKGLKDPLRDKHFDQLREIRTTFERVNRHSQISEEYKKIQEEMAVREKNYNDLVGRYEQLIGDFLTFIGKNDFEAKGFSEQELKLIKERYENMRKNDPGFGVNGMVPPEQNYYKVDDEERQMSPRGELATIKKIKKRRKKKRKSVSPKKKSRSPERRRSKRRRKKRNKSRAGKKYSNSNKKNKQFDFSDSDDDNYREDSPDIDIELSRISKNRGKIDLPPPQFGYIQQHKNLANSPGFGSGRKEVINAQPAPQYQGSEPRLSGQKSPNQRINSIHDNSHHSQPLTASHQGKGPLAVPAPPANPTAIVSSKNSRMPMSEVVPPPVMRPGLNNHAGNNPEKPTVAPNPPPNLPPPPQNKAKSDLSLPSKPSDTTPPPPPPGKGIATPPGLPKKSPLNGPSVPPRPPAQPGIDESNATPSYLSNNAVSKPVTVANGDSFGPSGGDLGNTIISSAKPSDKPATGGTFTYNQSSDGGYLGGKESAFSGYGSQAKSGSNFYASSKTGKGGTAGLTNSYVTKSKKSDNDPYGSFYSNGSKSSNYLD